MPLRAECRPDACPPSPRPLSSRHKLRNMLYDRKSDVISLIVYTWQKFAYEVKKELEVILHILPSLACIVGLNIIA